MIGRHRTALGLLGLSTAAVAQPRPDWVPIGTHVDGGVVEVDRASISTRGDVTYGWWRLALTEPRPDGAAREKHLDAVDCARRMATELELVSYRADSSVLADGRETESAAMTRMGPVTP